MESTYIKFLQRYISDNNGISINNIDIDADMFENDYIDSIGIFTLFVEIEEQFDIPISLNKLEDIDVLTIRNLSKIIENETSN